MITREEIEKMFAYNCTDRAINYCRKTYPKTCGDKMGEITDAFEAGAEWSKDFIIERAVKYLEVNFPDIENVGGWYKESFINNFRKTMDE